MRGIRTTTFVLHSSQIGKSRPHCKEARHGPDIKGNPALSILEWSYDFTDRGDRGPVITVSYPDNEEMAAVIDLLDRGLAADTREGYEVNCRGLCCKAPQGINWTMVVEFESPEVAVMAAGLIRERFGPPKVMTLDGEVDAMDRSQPRLGSGPK